MQTPQNIPAVTLGTSLLSAVDFSCILLFAAFANNTSNVVTVTVQDGKGKSLLPAISLDANSYTTVPLPDGGLYMQAGVKWQAGTGAAVDGWLKVAAI